MHGSNWDCSVRWFVSAAWRAPWRGGRTCKRVRLISSNWPQATPADSECALRHCTPKHATAFHSNTTGITPSAHPPLSGQLLFCSPTASSSSASSSPSASHSQLPIAVGPCTHITLCAGFYFLAASPPALPVPFIYRFLFPPPAMTMRTPF